MSRESRFISRVLRHAPQDANLSLDVQGWTEIRDLLRGMRAAGFICTRANLDEIVATNDKRRFEISENGQRIRACQGHSVPVDLGLLPATPPDVLFHGTASHALHEIFSTGILPMRRTHVHLSATQETAVKVGARHGSAIVLHVDAAAMHAEGASFYRANNGVWLTQSVPIGRFHIVSGAP